MQYTQFNTVGVDGISIELRVSFTCQYCRNQSTSIFTVSLGEVLPNLSLPNGWCIVNHVLICSLHRIKVTKAAKVAKTVDLIEGRRP